MLGDSSASEPGLQAASQPAETPAQQGKASVVAANNASWKHGVSAAVTA